MYFCEDAEETIYNLLWACPRVQHLLAEFVRVCNTKGTRIYFSHTHTHLKCALICNLFFF